MRRPWNIPNSPVYSLATCVAGIGNMNICTYVIPISMQPKLYAIAIYNETKTLENMLETETAVLQLLMASQFSLVNHLGKRSGFQFDKSGYLKKKELLKDWNGFSVLKEASALVLLKKLNHQQAGDHVLFTFEAIRYQSFSENILSVELLREKKIIRA